MKLFLVVQGERSEGYVVVSVHRSFEAADKMAGDLSSKQSRCDYTQVVRVDERGRKRIIREVHHYEAKGGK